jgi:hypothetical protein
MRQPEGLLNTVRFGFNRSNHESVNERLLNIPPSLSWISGQPFGYLTVSGMATEDFGDYRLPRLDRLNNWQYGDTVFLTRGAHGIKMGVDTQRIQFNQNTTSQVGGLLSFTNLSNFPARHSQSIRFRNTWRHRPGARLPPETVRLLRARRHSVAPEPDRESGTAL